MKIDPRIQSPGDPQSEAVSSAKKGSSTSTTARPASSSSSPAEDTIQISSQHAEAQKLAAQVAQVPEVRTERTEPLKAAVQQGSYRPESGKIADAMLAEQTSKSAKA